MMETELRIEYEDGDRTYLFPADARDLLVSRDRRIAELEAERDALKAEIAAGKKARGAVYREVERLRRAMKLAVNACDDADGMDRDPVLAMALLRSALEPADAGEIPDAFGLLHDPCHEDVGRGRAARTARRSTKAKEGE